MFQVQTMPMTRVILHHAMAGILWRHVYLLNMDMKAATMRVVLAAEAQVLQKEDLRTR